MTTGDQLEILLLFGVEDAGHVTIEQRLADLFLSFYCFSR